MGQDAAEGVEIAKNSDCSMVYQVVESGEEVAVFVVTGAYFSFDIVIKLE